MSAAAVPIIGSVLGGLLGFSAAGRAGKAIANANIAAEHGVLDATKQGQAGVEQAGYNAPALVNAATGEANNTLQKGLDSQTANLQPYLAGGAQGTNSLAAYAASNPTFKFAPTMEELENTPGYKFQLAQGTQAVNNSASAGGLLSSGNTLEALQNYGQGLAGTYYQNAFKNAQDTFQTNQNSTLANLSTLAGIGLSGTNQYDAAVQNTNKQQAGNTLAAGYYGGNTGIDVSKYNAGLGLQGSTLAGNFAVGAGNATAAGIQGGANSLLGGLSGVTNSIPGFGSSYGPPGATVGDVGYRPSPLSLYNG